MPGNTEAILYDINGDPLAIDDGVVIPVGTPLIMFGGSDGTNARYVKVDSSGNQIMVGLGTAGTPAGGVLTIQGSPSGIAIPISGTVTANAGSGNFAVVQATAANLNATVIGTVTANIGTTGGLALDATLAKLTISQGTALGSNTQALIGGSVTTVAPTYTNGNINPVSLTTAGAIRVDGSGVTQPVSGTITANQGTSPWVSNITQFGSSNVVTGTGASGSGIPRVTVSNDSNILATQSGTWTVQPGNTANTTPWLATINQGGNSAAVKAASTQAAAADPSLVVAISPNSNGVNIWDNHFYVQSNATVTVTGSQVISGNFYGVQQINLIVNVKASPTGSNPTITYTIQEVDPGDNTTTFGNSANTQTITGIGVFTASLATTNSSSIKVTWTVTGSSPSFTQVYSTVIAKATSTTVQAGVASLTASSGVAFGRCTGVANSFQAIRATTYTEQTTNFTGSVKSSSASDAAAGTGARTVLITYFDQTGAGPFTETVTLNGTTAVNLVNSNHCYIEKMMLVTVGSNATNVGTITLFTGAGGTGTNVGSIGIGNIIGTRGDNSTLWAHHYTPINKITSIFIINAGSPGNQGADISLWSVPILTANAAEIKVSDSIVSASNSDSASRSSPVPIKITGFARTTMYVVPNGSNTNFAGGFDYADQ